MTLVVQQLSLDTIAALRPLVPRIAQRDRSLAQQLQRAASSVALNIAEAAHSDAGNRRARFSTAAGSANETRMALRVAIAWGYLSVRQADAADALLDRVLAMLWRLGRGR